MFAMVQRKIEHAAEKGRVLTLDEVAAWVQDAMRSGTAGDTPVEARVTFGGKLQRISVDIRAGRSARETTA